MADAALNILFQNLRDFLLYEASVVRGLRSSFEEIKLELDSMRSFLRDADSKKDSDEQLGTWVGQVRGATYDVEDIIDDFMYHMNKPKSAGFTGFILETIRLPKMIFAKHQFALRLKEQKKKIVAISVRKDQYHLDNMEGSSVSGANSRWHHGRENSHFIDADEIVGQTEQTKQLIQWLTEEEAKRKVIALVGMGGVGKTTLAAKSYKNQMVEKHFDSSVWISVSQSYSAEEILRIVIQDLFRANRVKVPGDLGSMIRRQLLQMVNDLLEDKRYIVVLDDVWSVNAWMELNVAFPRNRCGSRIMLTTRHENVAFALGDGSCSYPLEPLQENEAWNLFCKNAFGKEACPQELEALALSIAKKCQGLPLAIVALGRLMSMKAKTMPEWHRVYNNLIGQLSSNQMLEPIKHILLLSFYNLPYRLKHCFLYCCIFPEDYLINRKRLIRLWVAEGFVEDGGRITMEEAAEDYLNELVHCNMLQVVDTNDIGRVRTCRVHDIVREVALSLCNEEKFCLIFDGYQARQDGNFRRISVYNGQEITQWSTNMSNLRSFLVFDKSNFFSSSLCIVSSSFRLLRVLNLEGSVIVEIPGELTDLFNLRYLSLRGTKVSKLPKSLEKLRNLQTLDLHDTKVERLPRGIVKLEKLRHLFVCRIDDSKHVTFHFAKGIKLPPGVCNIKSLQRLGAVEADGNMVTEVGNLTQLRKLAISKLREADGVQLCASVAKMNHLYWFAAQAASEEEALELEAISLNPPPLLQKLRLSGHLKKVPQWLSSLTNLTQLRLHWSRLKEEEEEELLRSLQALPNLACLWLFKAYEGKRLWFHDGWFPKLKRLFLLDLTQLSMLVIEKGAMSCIRELHLIRCPELKILPQGIQYLSNLEKLILEEMPTVFIESLRKEGGHEEDRQKIAHIPFIQHQGKIEDGRWDTERFNH